MSQKRLVILVLSVFFARITESCAGVTLQIDLDRFTEGIQTEIEGRLNETSFVPDASPKGRLLKLRKQASAYYTDVKGSVVVTGTPEEEVGGFFLRLDIENLCNPGVSLDCVDVWTGPGEIPDGGSTGIGICEDDLGENYVGRNNLGALDHAIGEDGVISLFHFDVRILAATGDSVQFSFAPVGPPGFFSLESTGPLAGTGDSVVLAGLPNTCPTPTKTPTPMATHTPTPTFTLTHTPTPSVTRTRAPTPSFTGVPPSPMAAIDLNRDMEGVQSVHVFNPEVDQTLRGAVVVRGDPTTTVKDFAIEIRGSRSNGGDPINCNESELIDGELVSAFRSHICTSEFFRKSALFVNPEISLGGDQTLVVFAFDLAPLCEVGETLSLDFVTTNENSQLGITVNSEPRTFGPSSRNPIYTEGATIYCGNYVITPTPTPTQAPTATPRAPCPDAGFYLLDTYGGRHRVGNPISIAGPLYYGRNVASDMEASSFPDLALLDVFGAVQFVETPQDTPAQMFYWPEGTTPPCGTAVDLVMSNDSTGFWVLTEGGGIFRGGSALPPGEQPQLGDQAAELCAILPLPFGDSLERGVGLPLDDGSSVRAVGFVVVQTSDPATPEGFVILDSQGGHYIFGPDGGTLADNAHEGILATVGETSTAVYPFFRGLDIARDIEIHPDGDSQSGVIILDGWGGVHPVPVEFIPATKVSFIRNELPGATSIVGLPYLTQGFDNPQTEVDEANPTIVGPDVASILVDLEFCSIGDGVYVLDRFGGIFVFGNTRSDPDENLPRFSGSPYFFPHFLAQDMEPVEETGRVLH